MKTCPNCNRECRDEATVCPHCGWVLEPDKLLEEYKERRPAGESYRGKFNRERWKEER